MVLVDSLSCLDYILYIYNMYFVVIYEFVSNWKLFPRRFVVHLFSIEFNSHLMESSCWWCIHVKTYFLLEIG